VETFQAAVEVAPATIEAEAVEGAEVEREAREEEDGEVKASRPMRRRMTTIQQLGFLAAQTMAPRSSWRRSSLVHQRTVIKLSHKATVSSRSREGISSRYRASKATHINSSRRTTSRTTSTLAEVGVAEAVAAVEVDEGAVVIIDDSYVRLCCDTLSQFFTWFRWFLFDVW